MAEESEDEQDIRSTCAAGDYRSAATAIVQRYGAEIQGFLNARLRSTTDGEEAFSMFVEDLWLGLPGFSWRCSARGWAYTLARNASNRLSTAPFQRLERNLTLTERANLSALVEQARSVTRVHLRTEVKAQVRAIREKLDPDDQMLLTLRVDKQMSFRELALVMNDAQFAPDRLDEEAARLRKRFERVKARIRELAHAEGLVESDD